MQEDRKERSRELDGNRNGKESEGNSYIRAGHNRFICSTKENKVTPPSSSSFVSEQ